MVEVEDNQLAMISLRVAVNICILMTVIAGSYCCATSAAQTDAIVDVMYSMNTFDGEGNRLGAESRIATCIISCTKAVKW